MSLNPHTDTPDRLRRAESAGRDTAEAAYATGRSLILAGDIRGGWAHLQRALALKSPASFRVAPLDVRGPTA